MLREEEGRGRQPHAALSWQRGSSLRSVSKVVLVQKTENFSKFSKVSKTRKNKASEMANGSEQVRNSSWCSQRAWGNGRGTA